MSAMLRSRFARSSLGDGGVGTRLLSPDDKRCERTVIVRCAGVLFTLSVVVGLAAYVTNASSGTEIPLELAEPHTRRAPRSAKVVAQSFEEALRHLEGSTSRSQRGSTGKAGTRKRDEDTSKRSDVPKFEFPDGYPDPAHATEADKEKARAIIEDFIGKLAAAEDKDGAKSEGRQTADDIIAESVRQLEEQGKRTKEKDDLKTARDIIKKAKESMPSGALNAEDEAKLNSLLKEEEVKQKEKAEEASQQEESKTPSASQLDGFFKRQAAFSKLLNEEKQRIPEHTIKAVRAEFEQDFGRSAKPLMCSGCKLIAARIGTELRSHEVEETAHPSEMLVAHRKALDATCKSFRHLDVVKTSRGDFAFEAREASEKTERARVSQRFCSAVLESARFDMFSSMASARISDGSQPPQRARQNWERFICVQHARVCKRREVRDDDEEEED
eukprot:TRINITY_DN27541_c0_g1_i1.p1 TRINITY_DN27541_c0_g1~~TRINITY_DN27541_c0_g1_i1.p1  ORF type:complete len:443 (-),score=115.11 TRINITY_DN27541_c0_g1_i1:103-1431(-)